jgi:AAA domain-containing protein
MMGDSLEEQGKPARYRMIDQLIAKNFRCFESLNLSDFSRINVIVGDNASGKTALLETIFFGAAGNPEVASRLRVLRGLDMIQQITRDRSGYESLWRELFFAFDQKRTVSAQIIGSAGNNRLTEMLYKAGDTTLPLNGGGEANILRLITFRGTDVSGKEFDIQPEITDRGITPALTGEAAPVSFFSATIRSSATEAARGFSDLSKANEHLEIVAAIKKEFDFVQDLSIEIDAGGGLLYANLKGQKYKVRLGLVSAGLDRLVSFLVAIQKQTEGVVLIDEGDNGIYYKRLDSMWRMLHAFSIRHHTQLFISTHSEECLKAMLPILVKHQNDFLLIHLQRNKTIPSPTVRTISGANMRAAIGVGIELR